MPSSYQPNIPTGLVNLDTDYLNLQNNFSQLDTTFGVDHYKFSDTTSNNGFHKQSTYPNQTIVPTTVATQIAIYSKVGVNPTSSDLYMIRDGNAGTETQLTTSKIAAPTAGAAVGASGQSWLPGGILLIWGSFDPNSSTSVTFPFSGFPTVCVNIQFTGSADNNSTFRSGLSTGTLSKTGFTWEGTISSHWKPIFYLAIGN